MNLTIKMKKTFPKVFTVVAGVFFVFSLVLCAGNALAINDIGQITAWPDDMPFLPVINENDYANYDDTAQDILGPFEHTLYFRNGQCVKRVTRSADTGNLLSTDYYHIPSGSIKLRRTYHPDGGISGETWWDTNGNEIASISVWNEGYWRGIATLQVTEYFQDGTVRANHRATWDTDGSLLNSSSETYIWSDTMPANQLEKRIVINYFRGTNKKHVINIYELTPVPGSGGSRGYYKETIILYMRNGYYHVTVTTWDGMEHSYFDENGNTLLEEDFWNAVYGITSPNSSPTANQEENEIQQNENGQTGETEEAENEQINDNDNIDEESSPDTHAIIEGIPDQEEPADNNETRHYQDPYFAAEFESREMMREEMQAEQGAGPYHPQEMPENQLLYQQQN